MSACFLSPLDVTLIDDRRGLWRLDASLAFFSEIIGERVVVPSKFETDFASVPRLPVIYVTYANRNRKAATIHDFLYRVSGRTRSVCDAVFLEAMRADGETLEVAWAMWIGVRLFGWFAYNKRTKEVT